MSTFSFIVIIALGALVVLAAIVILIIAFWRK
jgi:hypothetical protein